jgi:hypothetical protein
MGIIMMIEGIKTLPCILDTTRSQTREEICKAKEAEDLMTSATVTPADTVQPYHMAVASPGHLFQPYHMAVASPGHLFQPCADGSRIREAETPENHITSPPKGIWRGELTWGSTTQVLGSWRLVHHLIHQQQHHHNHHRLHHHPSCCNS